VSAEIHNIARHRRFRSNFPTVALPEGLRIFSETMGLHIGDPAAFRFRRTALGTEMWLHFDAGARLNLSAAESVYLKNVEAARAWAYDFASRHGFEPREILSPRARHGDLTKPETREMTRMIVWQNRFRRHYKPSSQESRRACDQLVSRGMAEEHKQMRNSFVWHDGAWRAEPSYLATTQGREWFSQANPRAAEHRAPESVPILRPANRQPDPK
jgi:hypothetical protein